jgi:hypothetical protein
MLKRLKIYNMQVVTCHRIERQKDYKKIKEVAGMVLLAEGGEQIPTTTKYRRILYLSLLQDLSNETRFSVRNAEAENAGKLSA